MKKRDFVLITAILCTVSLAIGAAANGIISEIKAQLRPDFTIEIDGVKREFKNVDGETVYPVLYNGTTYLPIRAIGEIMGKTVYWYENEKRIELKEEKTTVTDADVIITDLTQPQTSQPAQPPVQGNSVDKSQFITTDKAKEIALSKAGLTADEVIFDRTELDNDDGIWHYEVKFRKGFTEYDADIKADDGTILKWEIDKDD